MASVPLQLPRLLNITTMEEPKFYGDYVLLTFPLRDPYDLEEVMDMFEDGAVDEVFVCILQPYASRKEPAVCRYTRESVEQARAFFRACIEQAQDEHAPLKPSEKACRYCRAQSSCPAVKLALVNVTSGDLTAAWEEWSPEKRREAYDLAKLAKKWAASVEAKVKADLKAELEIPGLCLTSGKKAFTVTDAAAAFPRRHHGAGVYGLLQGRDYRSG